MLVVYNRKTRKIVLLCQADTIDGRKTLSNIFPGSDGKDLHAFHISDNTSVNIMTHRVKIDSKGQPFAIEPLASGGVPGASVKIENLEDSIELEVL